MVTLPKPLYLQLKEVAAANNRSIAGEVRHVVEAYLRGVK